MSEKVICVDEISKVYPIQPTSERIGAAYVKALDRVSFQVREGQVYGLIGLSGAGKSTALRSLNLLERPDQGTVYLDGENLLKKRPEDLLRVRQKVGMIFQHFNLLANRDVAGNVAFPLEVAGWERSRIDQRVREYLDLMRLGDKLHAYPAQLSGGQKQRVAIARAIANHPKVLLADEPTSALDPLTKNEIIGCLADLNRQLGLTIVIAAHEMKVIKKLCHRISLFRGGRIEETLDVVNGGISPRTDYGRAFVEDL